MNTDDILTREPTPPPAFHFEVKFEGSSEKASIFKDISGLSVDFKNQDIAEQGANYYIQKLPKGVSLSNLILTRCLVPNPALESWCKNCFESFILDPKDLIISLAINGDSIASWHCINAYPVFWELVSLNSTSTELAIEMLELGYSFIRRI